MVLPLQIKLVRPPPPRLVQVPGAVDRPVAEVARAREFQRARIARVVQEVPDQGWDG